MLVCRFVLTDRDIHISFLGDLLVLILSILFFVHILLPLHTVSSSVSAETVVLHTFYS